MNVGKIKLKIWEVIIFPEEKIALRKFFFDIRAYAENSFRPPPLVLKKSAGNPDIFFQMHVQNLVATERLLMATEIFPEFPTGSGGVTDGAFALAIYSFPPVNNNTHVFY